MVSGVRGREGDRERIHLNSNNEGVPQLAPAQEQLRALDFYPDSGTLLSVPCIKPQTIR